ncbi:adhesion G-protein coupled receptor G2-like isoform X3 [Osmerus eperlanus]|uniref:adhesion G-protein coupled receptor G2-like isoform X3 n=1 Tax=Osmerus eperlanus TaxID=29151 RepID=UPI002E11C36E
MQRCVYYILYLATAELVSGITSETSEGCPDHVLIIHDNLTEVLSTNVSSLNFTCPIRNLTENRKLFLYVDVGKMVSSADFDIQEINLSTMCDKEKSLYNETTCADIVDKTSYILTVTSEGLESCQTCDNPVKKPDMELELDNVGGGSGGVIDAAAAAGVMNNLSSLLERMGNSTTAALSMGEVKGLLSRLPKEQPNKINFGFSSDKDMSIVDSEDALQREFSRSVHVSKEAVAMAVNRSGTFVGVLVFLNMAQDKLKSKVLNNEVVGIKMGAEIHNLTDTIDIHYRGVNQKECNAKECNFTCNSWNGEGEVNWTTDGCETEFLNDSIKCNCTHLSFFAILMSQTDKITSADMKSLTYISYIGSGLSMFFLGVALFMQCAMRLAKSNSTTKILLNLFLSLFFLNLTFLLNQTIAGLNNPASCVVMAAAMHYFMLSTFTWFFLEALHIFLQTKDVNTAIKSYLVKIYISGWVTPGLVVGILIILNKYQMQIIHVDDGSTVNMCWIPDVQVHYAVNIGYYTLVFLFNLAIFIFVVQQIHLQKKFKAKELKGSTPTNTFSILGLFSMLGLSWGFAFFSYGKMAIPSYYIFSIINSFQGFFLFIYYYKNSQGFEAKPVSVFTSSSTDKTTNTYDIN